MTHDVNTNVRHEVVFEASAGDDERIRGRVVVDSSPGSVLVSGRRIKHQRENLLGVVCEFLDIYPDGL